MLDAAPKHSPSIVLSNTPASTSKSEAPSTENIWQLLPLVTCVLRCV